ncbi:ABC transporter permease [Chloroflexota bacterium]
MATTRSNRTTVIRPRRGLFSLGLGELFEYRELLFYLAWRQIKIRYKQTLMGAAWAVIQPALLMVVFSVIFGVALKLPSEGIPYPVFSYSGLVLWMYFANSLTVASTSMVTNTGLITKVYFPRMLLPVSSTVFGFLDYAISLLLLVGMMFYYQTLPGIAILLLPVLLLMTFVLASGLALWFSAICIRYRDVQYAMPFLIQMLLFLTPVIYPPDFTGRFQWLLQLNPMSAIITAHRASLLGHVPVDYSSLGISTLIILFVTVTGLVFFRSNEKSFADLI